MNFVSKIAAKKGKILFVGTKRSAQDIVREFATACGMPYVNHRWLGGMLTNYKTVRLSIKRLKELENLFASNQLASFSKKEVLTLQRELTKLQRSLGGIKNMGGLPDIMFVVDVGHESLAITEANRLKIPVIGVVDTNSNPDNVDYIIPGNDDAIRAITLYVQTASQLISQAREAAAISGAEDAAGEGQTDDFDLTITPDGEDSAV